MARHITHIVIHCTASWQNATIADLRKVWADLGWSRPGYHVVIDAAGAVHRLEDDDQPTNGVAGQNAGSIHISYIGGIKRGPKGQLLPTDNRTQAQRDKLRELVLGYRKKYPAARILGHRNFPGVKKDCPCFDVASWLKEVGIV